MTHDYITSFLPDLDSKEPDINMAGCFMGNTGVHNINSRIIFFTNWSRIFLGKPKLMKHRHQEPSSIGISYSSNEHCFCGTQRIDLLIFRPVNNNIPGKCKRKSTSGFPLGRLIYVCSAHKTHPQSQARHR